jgi:hypothetical protein
MDRITYQMSRFLTGRRSATLRALLAVAAVLPMTGCDSPTDALLEATDPDIINPSDVTSPDAADALARGAVQRFKQMTAGAGFQQESMWLLGGMLADEYRLSDTFADRIQVDRRILQTQNAQVETAYRFINRARLASNQAIAALRQYRPTATADIGEMYMIRGFAEMTTAENFCNGAPLTEAAGRETVYGNPLSNAQLFGVALASVDSGLTAVGTGTDARSTLIRNSLRIVRGRILLNLARFADAAQAVTDVPVTTAYTLTFSVATGENRIWELTNAAGRWTVADNEGGNGLPFVSANDPRVPTCRGGTTGCRTVVASGNGFDGVTPLNGQLLWPTRESPVTAIWGVEAQLIRAEAQLRAGDSPGMLATLNELRANTALYRCPAATLVTGVASCSASPTALAPLADPGTQRAREDLLFRERAFWLFSTGHRLPDLRRLIRQYGRTQEQVFAVGTHPREPGPYGADVNFPVPQAEENNPNFKGCTDRNA